MEINIFSTKDSDPNFKLRTVKFLSEQFLKRKKKDSNFILFYGLNVMKAQFCVIYFTLFSCHVLLVTNF